MKKTFHRVYNKATNNSQESFKKASKNGEKIFKKTAKSSQASVLPFYVLDVLITAKMLGQGALTASNIITEIYNRVGTYYKHSQVCLVINNMAMYSQTVTIDTEEVHAGKSRAKAFSIQFKQL